MNHDVDDSLPFTATVAPHSTVPFFGTLVCRVDFPSLAPKTSASRRVVTTEQRQRGKQIRRWTLAAGQKRATRGRRRWTWAWRSFTTNPGRANPKRWAKGCFCASCEGFSPSHTCTGTTEGHNGRAPSGSVVILLMIVRLLKIVDKTNVVCVDVYVVHG